MSGVASGDPPEGVACEAGFAGGAPGGAVALAVLPVGGRTVALLAQYEADRVVAVDLSLPARPEATALAPAGEPATGALAVRGPLDLAVLALEEDALLVAVAASGEDAVVLLRVNSTAVYDRRLEGADGEGESGSGSGALAAQSVGLVGSPIGPNET
eukprot:CAMPEP_0206012432 /NCGR_PEP_ID=MMETSP1464-20131121/14832_1 /ASSEMBLY_ACC=CAM_ASM_001124 /TAXON_ID=119497 /ORGANISM="Exanthemachrysis gayraliae, Strain RCC1523" /LENGTH=156 /DNA_ID=CAMNT_0053386115 /DNA_START=17 /DNA_END=487 /DNA_ORIENTATION=-